MQKNIMIVGVGGQGTLLASRILGNLLVEKGYDVKVSEVHGMSQRGGSVVTYVKYGDKVYSPIIDKGEADIILAFERLEALRALPYLKKGGKIIVNDRATMPMPVITGNAEYPEGIIETLSAVAEVKSLDALVLAEEAGSVKAVNVVLIGVLAASTDIPKEEWIKVLCATVPQKLLDVNLKAFDLGYAL
ncbi:MAG: indolepyruvate oxidoreductase subunit beta [Clostridia bacterium]|nr:indolepyruvate oxidoreductase subunit beta [Clostridia bacterium]MBO7170856.1 indolepyruvate oxidoreductase subunit beta [Clostridia bacterium]